eukprot:CAMPEP_0115038492 /NCGR_PEP_ID=MMETSP0216-20121206/43441_1 /TAXON_ID=223996 /ORGANISM="Protocruzia adherens, Strain Boccale" /LENGTH=122 /DNA_ID=CAMNT_0002418903 /DNA_START=207 /DNA_END=571 /DNA_ORIENTATION=-
MVGNTISRTARGIIPRSMEHIFEKANADYQHEYKIEVAFIQIYMEMIQDLLEPDNENIRIREDPNQGVFVSGVCWVQVTNEDECVELLKIGDKNRSTAFTKLNAHSSRSHAVLLVKIERRQA